MNESNARLKAAKSGHSLTLVGKLLQSLVVKYDHDLLDGPSLVDVSNVARVRGDDTVISGVFVVVTLGAGLERKL